MSDCDTLADNVESYLKSRFTAEQIRGVTKACTQLVSQDVACERWEYFDQANRIIEAAGFEDSRVTSFGKTNPLANHDKGFVFEDVEVVGIERSVWPEVHTTGLSLFQFRQYPPEMRQRWGNMFWSWLTVTITFISNGKYYEMTLQYRTKLSLSANYLREIVAANRIS